MKSVFLLLCLSLAFEAKSQSIKMKIATITAAAGEDVIAFETGDTTSFSSSGGTPTATPTRFEFVKIKKLAGGSSNELFKRSTVGSQTADVTFEFNNSSAQLFYKISLKNVVITHFSYLSPECANCANLYHEVWFNFDKIEVTDAATGIMVGYDRIKKVNY